jgi:hypothetical protein
MPPIQVFISLFCFYVRHLQIYICHALELWCPGFFALTKKKINKTQQIANRRNCLTLKMRASCSDQSARPPCFQVIRKRPSSFLTHCRPGNLPLLICASSHGFRRWRALLPLQSSGDPGSMVLMLEQEKKTTVKLQIEQFNKVGNCMSWWWLQAFLFKSYFKNLFIFLCVSYIIIFFTITSWLIVSHSAQPFSMKHAQTWPTHQQKQKRYKKFNSTSD